MNVKQFDSITFDEVNQTFTIIDGTKGTFSISEIAKYTVLNEDAKFKGKTEPFLHQVLGGTAFVSMLVEPMVYVGLKIIMRDGSVLGVYVSKQKCVVNSDLYLKDNKIAEEIKTVITKMMNHN